MAGTSKCPHQINEQQRHLRRHAGIGRVERSIAHHHEHHHPDQSRHHDPRPEFGAEQAAGRTQQRGEGKGPQPGDQLAAALALGITSCAESGRDGDSGDNGNGGGTFTFGAAGAPEMFDPLYATDGETFRVPRQMFEGLLDIEPGGAEVVPGLATEWTANEDGTVWDFTLRDDVTFHDGTAFNAAAVCANFERMFGQGEAGQVAAEYWGYVMGGFANDPENSLYQSCEATDEFTAQVTITRATSGFPTMLSLSSLAMQSPTAMEEGDANGIAAQGEGFSFPAYAQAPVGTGPFQFGEYDEANATITLEAYDDYYGDAPKSSKLVFKVIADESTRRQELEAGSIDGYDLPDLTGTSPDVFEEGMVVCVETPYYELGFAGLQVEDMAVVRRDGLESLMRSSVPATRWII